jgi:hypothetical protein
VSVAGVDTEPLIRLAAALSSRPAELVAAVQRRAGPELAELVDSPERLRSATLVAFLASRGAVEAPEPIDRMPPALTALANRVGMLPRLDRAVLVLLYLEQLTRAEVAGIVDRPVAAVGQVLDRALSILDADPLELVAVLTMLSWQDVDPMEVSRAAVRLSERLRSRTRRRLLVGAATVALAAALVVPGVLDPPAPTAVWVRGHRDWVGSYRLDLPTGWDIESQIVGADVETKQLQGSGSGACQIVVDRTGATGRSEDARGGTRSVRVGGRAGRISAEVDRADLTWQLSEDASAVVTCSGVTRPAGFVTDLAARMAFGAKPIALPYQLGALPAHFHVDQVTVRPQQGTTVVDLWPDEVSEARVPISVVQSVGSASGFELPSLEVPGTTLRTSCRLLEETSVCAGVAGPGALDTPPQQARTALRLRLIMGGLVMAASAADRSTWYDARDALPRD